MRAAVLATLLFAAPVVARAADPLPAPGAWSFAPAAPEPDPLPPDPGSPGAGPHGIVSSTAGNRAAGAAAAVTDTLPDGRTRVTLEGGGGEATPWKGGPTLFTRNVGVGVSTPFADGQGGVSLLFDAGGARWGR